MSQYDRDVYWTYMGRGPKRMVHQEIWSCPDAESAITGIDHYDHPRLCRQRLLELYPCLGNVRLPATDAPIPRPRLGASQSADMDTLTVRWGDGETGSFRHGEAIFKSVEQVLAFSPLEKGDFRDWPHCGEPWDFRDEERLYQTFRARFPQEWGDIAPAESAVPAAGFYNTLFMWPVLTFGWELFLECCLDPRFTRIMDEFAEINRRVFRVFARLPVHFIVCHDDIVNTRGPVCSPAWMRRHIFSHYEEFWSIVRAAGKEVVFMSDGCMDAFVDDVMACGARGMVTEPYTDFKAIARRYDNVVLAGEGDNRVIKRNDPAEIERMVRSMAETGTMSGGYIMSVGNHLPWDMPGDGVKRYLDLCDQLAYRQQPA